MKKDTKGPKVTSIEMENDPQYQALEKLFETLNIKTINSTSERQVEIEKKKKPEKKNIASKVKSEQMKAQKEKKVERVLNWPTQTMQTTTKLVNIALRFATQRPN